MSCRPNISAGYTLIELLVVLAILSLVAFLAAPAASSIVDAATLRTDAHRLASDLMNLQRIAVEKHATVSVVSGQENLLVNGGPQFALSRAEAVQFAQGTEKLDYYPDGTSSGAILRIVEPHGTMSANVAWLTGAVSIAGGQ